MVSAVSELPKTREALPASADDLARRYYRPREVAEVTGLAVSTVFEALYSTELEGYRLGRAWLVPVDAVDRWIRGEAA